MDKPLLKLYLFLAVFFTLALQFIPAVASRTAAWAVQTVTRVELAMYRASTGNGSRGTPEGGKGNVVFIMDDGWETQYTRGYKKLKQYDFQACIAVIPSLVSECGYMDYHQLADLYMEGWDLLNHTYNHFNLLDLPGPEQARQVNMAQKWLNSRGLGRGSDIVVFPQGQWSESLLHLIKDEGFAAARSLDSLWSAKSDSLPGDVKFCNLISSITLDEVEAAITGAAENRSTLILILHKIEPVTVDTQMQLTEELFDCIVDLIYANANSLNVVTLTQLLAGVSLDTVPARRSVLFYPGQLHREAVLRRKSAVQDPVRGLNGGGTAAVDVQTGAGRERRRKVIWQ